jgi:hypothetical protein
MIQILNLKQNVSLFDIGDWNLSGIWSLEFVILN